MLDKTGMFHGLSSLFKLDINAADAYNKVLEQIDDIDVKQRIAEYRDDHNRHADTLSDLIHKMCEVPPERTKDIKDYLMEGFTAIRSAMGEKAAIKALEENEIITNRKYKDACNWDVDSHIKLIIEKHYQDEKVHLSYIQGLLHTKGR